MNKKLLSILIIIIITPIVIILLSDYKNLLFIRAREPLTEFHIFRNTPGNENRFPPQGITVVGSKLIISNHHLELESWIYELDILSGEINRSFVLPKEISHIGGLCWDGNFLYAVDYNTCKLYQINYEDSFRTGESVILKYFDTTLNGASACTVIQDREIPLMVISDFKNSSMTIIVDLEKSLANGTAENNILYHYQNESFSQGLCYWNGFLFEVENKIHKSIVNVYDVDKIITENTRKKIFLGQYFLPEKGGQDIYIDDNWIFVSDAVSFKIYQSKNDLNIE